MTTPLARLHAVEQDVAAIQNLLNLTPPPPPQPPARWADRAGPDDWNALTAWVDSVIADYSIRGGDFINPCWPLHPGVVEELASIWRAWIAAMIADQVTGADGTSETAMWHTYWFWPCLLRLKDNQYTMTNCRVDHHHVVSVTTPRLTDRSCLPPPPPAAYGIGQASENRG